jgi:hypothetical protein
MKAEVADAIIGHCAALSDRMDEKGRSLIRTGWGVDPARGIESAFTGSVFTWTVIVDGEIVGMFGGADSGEPGVGYPWLVTAPGIEKVRLRFIRKSPGYVRKMFERYELLVCNAHKENKALLGWIRWLGFEMEDLKNGFMKGRLEKCAFHR